MRKQKYSKILSRNDFYALEKYCSQESISHLKNSLDSLRKGKDVTPSFPLYGKRDDSVVREWLKILRNSDCPDWLIEYEESRLAKFGPQGGLPAWDKLKENFLLYKTAPKDVTYVDSDVMDEMLHDYSQLYCKPKSSLAALEHLKRSNKIETRAAGWSEFQLKKTDPEAQDIALRFCDNGNWVHGVGYTFARYNKLKYRLFMPMPYSLMIKQSQYYIPFLGNIQMDVLQSGARSLYTPWAEKLGFDKCFYIMEKELQNSAIDRKETLVYFSNDFEKMDTRTGTSQYDNFFIPVMNAAFGDLQDPELAESIRMTTTAPIYSPSGTMTGNHGTASGAEVTNGGECVGNDYFQRRFLKILRRLLPHGWRILVRRINGDDSILIFAITISFDVFKNACMRALHQACDETGWDIQFEKLDFSTKFGKFCQNVLSYDKFTGKLFWCYPSVLILNSIVNPEHQYKKSEWDKDYRDLDIVEKLDNGKNHPLFHQLIDFVDNGMKFKLLGRSELETKRIISKYEAYRALQSLGERYNRVDYDIRFSPTVQYVLSRR